MNTLFFFHLYLGFSVFVLALGLWTAVEDEKILKQSGEQYDGSRLDLVTFFLLVVLSFFPLINIGVLALTLIYRSEGKVRVRSI